MPTWLAATAHQTRLDRHPVPDVDVVHAVGDGDHYTDHLMSEVVGGFHKKVLTVDASLVRAAEARDRHLDQRLSGLERRYGLGDHFDNVGAADNDTSPSHFFPHGISYGC